ncbi:MAG: ABC transporter permease [Candidatus Nanopelagicales bacterium]|jgi:spermidine/putrescine transport system permease protein|nr:ABC transporter permease [Candidatus Nanopelagicales bacterium]MDP4715884.1 ABC transporter permease [Candidatus Nanopelagicales bacterium]MDP4905820.1 ABC transporter permease [Candidatus Nanopelagicales bacterium]MDP4975334.1 ABC transporter permease [Candidatus Nanopelagicales bacterium]MDP5095786.1 ABC transporter permease [Candidatus Nanopelagicales bacterium]
MSWLRKNLIPIIGILVLVYLFIPIAVVAILSFNKPAGKFNVAWNEFSLAGWQNICGVPGVCSSFLTSIQIGFLSTLVGTLFGTMIAFGLVRYRFRGRSTTNLLIFLPMATPEVVLGSSLLALFLNLAFPLGFWTVTIAHIMFVISFVVVTVKARLQGMDPRLEEAARDLYADPRSTFRYVTFPLVLPGILGAALLGFSLSFDDYIISAFNAGTLVTFPIYIWGAAQRGIPVQVNALATLVFLLTLALVLTVQFVNSRRRRNLERAVTG